MLPVSIKKFCKVEGTTQPVLCQIMIEIYKFHWWSNIKIKPFLSTFHLGDIKKRLKIKNENSMFGYIFLYIELKTQN